MNAVTSAQLDLMPVKKARKVNKNRLKHLARLKREDELNFLPDPKTNIY